MKKITPNGPTRLLSTLIGDGGGGAYSDSPANNPQTGGDGGNGVVIIRYAV